MGYTLDQLLDATGVTDLSGERLVKNAAAERQNLSKLAERCRRAVDVTPDEADASNQQGLVEKTAAIAVISRTLAEIDEIDGASPETIKTATQSQTGDQALFIKASLEAGHSPPDIAEFLEKNAVFGRVGRAIKTRMAVRGHKKGLRMGAKVEAHGKADLRRWQDIIRKAENVSPSEKASLVSRMRRDLGDDVALGAFGSMKNHGFKKEIVNLQKSVPAKAATGQAMGPGGKPLAASVGVGGKNIGLTSDQLKKAKKPAMYAGAGVLGHHALTRKNQDQGGSKRGPVIITT